MSPGGAPSSASNAQSPWGEHVSTVQGFPSSHPAAVHWQPVTTTSSTASPGKNSEESLVRFHWSWIVLLE